MRNNGVEHIARPDGALQILLLPENGAVSRQEAQLILNPNQEFLLPEGFGNKVDRTQLETLYNTGRIVERREKYGRNMTRSRILFHNLKHLETIQPRHHHIEQHQIGQLRLNIRERLYRIGIVPGSVALLF